MPTFSFLSKDSVTLQAGEYDRRIHLQKTVNTPDGMGGFTTTWQDVIVTWAHIEPWRGKEFWRDEQIYPTTWTRVLIRWRPGMNIDASMQVLYGVRVLNIRSIYPIAEARKVIELLCEELQAKGSSH